MHALPRQPAGAALGDQGSHSGVARTRHTAAARAEPPTPRQDAGVVALPGSRRLTRRGRVRRLAVRTSAWWGGDNSGGSVTNPRPTADARASDDRAAVAQHT